jgi:anti-sigma-K factor RskA
MSQVTGGDPTHLDALAAEYVLGTLDPDERNQARILLTSDENFAARVKLWERRLGELHLMVEPVEPDGKLWERIKVKVPQVPPGGEIKLPEQPGELPAAAPAVAPAPPDAETASPPTSPEAAADTEAKPAAEEAAPAAALEEAPAAAERSWAPRLAPRAPGADAPPQPAAPPPSPGVVRPPAVEARRRPDEAATARRKLARWRVVALLMMLVVVAVAALLAAWKWVPDRVPGALQPAALLRLIGVSAPAGAPVRPPAPPESSFDE